MLRIDTSAKSFRKNNPWDTLICFVPLNKLHWQKLFRKCDSKCSDYHSLVVTALDRNRQGATFRHRFVTYTYIP